MAFALGATSLAHLQAVHPSLRAIVMRAIELTDQDFGVHEGVRTVETQREYVRTGVSKTMDSKHLPQSDGFSHAVDLVPYIAGKLRWEWPPIYQIASAVVRAAHELTIEVTWGAVWDRTSLYLPTTADGLKSAVDLYRARHPGDDFIDGPHWQRV